MDTLRLWRFVCGDVCRHVSREWKWVICLDLGGKVSCTKKYPVISNKNPSHRTCKQTKTSWLVQSDQILEHWCGTGRLAPRSSGQQPTVAELSTSAMGFKEETYDGLSSYDRFLLDANCNKEHHRTLDLYPLLMPPPELHGERSCDTNMLVKPLKPFVKIPFKGENLNLKNKCLYVSVVSTYLSPTLHPQFFFFFFSLLSLGGKGCWHIQFLCFSSFLLPN